VERRKESAGLIEEQLREKDRECNGICPWWHGKGGENCFLPISIGFGLPM